MFGSHHQRGKGNASVSKGLHCNGFTSTLCVCAQDANIFSGKEKQKLVQAMYLALQCRSPGKESHLLSADLLYSVDAVITLVSFLLHAVLCHCHKYNFCCDKCVCCLS